MKALSLALFSTPTERRASPLGLAISALRRALARDRGLRQLCELDDRMLRDIGLTRADIERSRRQW